jgi:hypothetical protein
LQENNWKMEILFKIIQFKRIHLFIEFYVFDE